MLTEVCIVLTCEEISIAVRSVFMRSWSKILDRPVRSVDFKTREETVRIKTPEMRLKVISMMGDRIRNRGGGIEDDQNQKGL